MFRPASVLMCGGLAVGLLWVAGCASTGSAATAQDAHATHAVMCPQCETVWLAQSTGSAPRPVSKLTHSRQMSCPDCDTMAHNQLTGDGKVMLHGCPSCKVTPQLLSPAQPDTRDLPR